MSLFFLGRRTRSRLVASLIASTAFVMVSGCQLLLPESSGDAGGAGGGRVTSNGSTTSGGACVEALVFTGSGSNECGDSQCSGFCDSFKDACGNGFDDFKNGCCKACSGLRTLSAP